MACLEFMATHGSGTPGRRGSNTFLNRSWPSVWRRIFWGKHKELVSNQADLNSDPFPSMDRSDRSEKRCVATASCCSLSNLGSDVT